MALIDVEDLPASVLSKIDAAELDIMVAGANAKAARVAPCLVADDPTPTEDQLAEAKLLLLGALKRWADAGSGALQQQTAGPFTVTTDTRQRPGHNLWPSEIEGLQAICASASTGGGGIFAIDTAPGSATLHADTCSLTFGATYCSCGADIAGVPIFGPPEL